jgi:hypothetical protein
LKRAGMVSDSATGHGRRQRAERLAQVRGRHAAEGYAGAQERL